MKRLVSWSGSLLLLAVLAVVAAMCTVSTAYAAGSSPPSMGNAARTMHPADSLSTAASNAPCNLKHTISKCQSTDPTVTVSTYAYGGTGGIVDCTFVWDFSWGDGHSSPATLVNPHVGWRVTAQHTYAKPGVYTMTATGTAEGANCTLTPFVVTFTLLPPSPACVTPRSNTKPTTDFPWAGYGLYPDCGVHVKSVTATWRVPKVNCPNNGGQTRAAVWVGMWGRVDNSWLPQIGTNSDCANGYMAVYQLPSNGAAWLTLLSGLQYGSAKYATVKNFSIHSNDLISASVTYDGKNFIGQQKFGIWIKDHNTGKVFSRSLSTPIPASLDQVAGAGGAMVEDDTGGLAEFNSRSGHRLDISSLDVTFDANPAHWTAIPYRIALNGHYLTDKLSRLTSNGNFSATWKTTK